MKPKYHGGPVLHYPPVREGEIFHGLTVRDHFAGLALQALVTGFNSTVDGHNWTHSDFADEAYKMADAMLVERAKGGAQ